MEKHDVIVIGASAGGVEALRLLFSALPVNLAASVFVVLHVRPYAPSFLPAILNGNRSLPVAHAIDGEKIEFGRAYVAPPDRHLLIESGHVHLSAGPKENRSRPAINPLFRSAALAYGPRVIGVVLTGTLDDGTLGLWEIKRRGGLAIVQEPGDAEYRQMPQSAIQNVSVDYKVPLREIGPLLVSLSKQTVEQRRKEKEYSAMLSEDTNLTCPDCRGPLRRVMHGDLLELRCRIGHAYSPQNILVAHDEAEERVLWSTIEMLEEGADLRRQLMNNVPHGRENEFQQEIAKKSELAKKMRALIEEAKIQSLKPDKIFP